MKTLPLLFVLCFSTMASADLIRIDLTNSNSCRDNDTNLIFDDGCNGSGNMVVYADNRPTNTPGFPRRQRAGMIFDISILQDLELQNVELVTTSTVVKNLTTGQPPNSAVVTEVYAYQASQFVSISDLTAGIFEGEKRYLEVGKTESFNVSDAINRMLDNDHQYAGFRMNIKNDYEADVFNVLYLWNNVQAELNGSPNLAAHLLVTTKSVSEPTMFGILIFAGLILIRRKQRTAI